MVNYDPKIAFDFAQMAGGTANDVILDYAELVWCVYFSVVFGMFGTSLERMSNFVYQLRIFGFYQIWTSMRDEPVFVDSYIVEGFLRCFAASVMGATVTKMFKADQVVWAWTIVTVAAGYAINLADPLLRKHAGCSAAAGPPSENFPYGVWQDCDDWQFAYWSTWIYSAFAYILAGLAGCLGYLTRDNQTVIRMGQQLAVAMISTSAAITGMRSFVRRIDVSGSAWETFVDLAFYVLLGMFFLVQECIHQVKTRCLGIDLDDPAKGSKGWMGCLLWTVALPLMGIEKLLAYIERKIFELNAPDETEDAVSRTV